MIVTRVPHGTGTSIEPALDTSWSELDQLRWRAAVTSLDCGFEIEVRPSQLWVNGEPARGGYDVLYPGGCSNAGPFHEAWALICGIGCGVHAARRPGAAP